MKLKVKSILFLILPLLAGCRIADLHIKEGEVDPWHKFEHTNSIPPAPPQQARRQRSQFPAKGSLRASSGPERRPEAPQPAQACGPSFQPAPSAQSVKTTRPGIPSQLSVSLAQSAQEASWETLWPAIWAFRSARATSCTCIRPPTGRPQPLVSLIVPSQSCTKYEKRPNRTIPAEFEAKIPFRGIQEKRRKLFAVLQTATAPACSGFPLFRSSQIAQRGCEKGRFAITARESSAKGKMQSSRGFTAHTVS